MPYVAQCQCFPERPRPRHSRWVGFFEENLDSNVLPVLPNRIHAGFCDLTLGNLYASQLTARLWDLGVQCLAIPTVPGQCNFINAS